MKYTVVKFRVHLLSSKPFVIYTGLASLRTSTQSTQLSQIMAIWFIEYNFEVEYNPGKQNALAGVFSCRTD